MSFKLSHKLFLAHALIIVVLVITFLVFSYVSNKTLLSNAMNGIDEKVIENLLPVLAQRYKTPGAWSDLQTHQEQWDTLVNAHFFQVFFSYAPKFPAAPPANNDAAKLPDSASAPPTKTCEPAFGTFLQRLSLLDKNKKPLINAPMLKSDVYQRPIKVNGEVIGWLSVGKINVDALPLAGYFFEQQLRFTFWAALCAGTITLLLGFLLSRHITLPILLIAREAQKLARRDFSVNIQVNTRDELQALAGNINDIAQELNQYSLQQKQWLMDISHELRTPLTILYGEVTAILDNVSEINIDTIRSLQEEVMHLNRLVDDLHSLSAFDHIHFSFTSEPVELVELINFHATRYRERFEKVAINLCVECSEIILVASGDRDRLGQVVRNVLENNLRYTQSPGLVSLQASKENNYAKIIIEDSGPGVAAELLPKLFDRLYRVDASRNRVSGGAGLGLAICKTIVEAHGGSITAFVSTHGGLGVCILLPLEVPAEL